MLEYIWVVITLTDFFDDVNNNYFLINSILFANDLQTAKRNFHAALD